MGNASAPADLRPYRYDVLASRRRIAKEKRHGPSHVARSGHRTRRRGDRFVWLAQTHKDDQPDGRPAVEGQADASVHLALGNPSAAIDDPANPDNFLMRKEYYALSYNNAKARRTGCPGGFSSPTSGRRPRAQFITPTPTCRGRSSTSSRTITQKRASIAATCVPRGDRTSTPEAATATFAHDEHYPASAAREPKGLGRLRGLLPRQSLPSIMTSSTSSPVRKAAAATAPKAPPKPSPTAR